MDDLVNDVQNAIGCTAAHARLVCDAVLASVASRAKLTLRGFGSFKRDASGALTFKSSVRAPRLAAESAAPAEAFNEASELAKE